MNKETALFVIGLPFVIVFSIYGVRARSEIDGRSQCQSRCIKQGLRRVDAAPGCWCGTPVRLPDDAQ